MGRLGDEETGNVVALYREGQAVDRLGDEATGTVLEPL